MKNEIDSICKIMDVLLAYQPIIDVSYEKINDIAIALVNEGYGDISEYKAEIERLKAENAYLLKACEGQFTFDTTENKKYSIFNSVRKDFADEVKAKLFAIYGKTICSDLDTEDITDIIDELIKEVQNDSTRDD